MTQPGPFRRLENDVEGKHADNEPAGERPAGEAKPGGKPAAGGPTGEAKKRDHRELIIILVSVVGVILAYLTYRSRSGSAASSADSLTSPTADSFGTGADTGIGSGTVAGAGGDGSDAGDGLASLLSQQTGILSQLEATLTAGSGTLSTTPAKLKSTDPAKPPTFYLDRGLKFIRNLTTGKIFEVDPNGKTIQLTPKQIAELGGTKALHPTGFDKPRKAVVPKTLTKAPAKPKKK